MDQLVEQWAAELPELNADPMTIVGRIMRLGRHYEKQASAALKPFGLPYTDFDILATLRRSGAPYELTPGELSEAVLLTSGAMTAALDRLQSAHLITRHASDQDRRVKSARLTAKGKRLAARAAKARFAIASDAISDLSDAEQRTLKKVLRQLAV